jgi:hypothetical protein
VKANIAAEITPAKLRAGEPGALAALCYRRGAAVYAYCQAATGRDDVADVAAEALAEFRLAILPPGTLTSKKQAETLLRSVTRRVALTHADDPPIEGDAPADSAACDGREAEILGYVEQTLPEVDREIVTAHVGHCRLCAAVLERLQAAERAFKVAPGTTLPAAVLDAMLTALVEAAPVSAHGGDKAAVREEALRLLTPDPEPEPEPASDPAAELDREPEPEPEPGSDAESEPVPDDSERPKQRRPGLTPKAWPAIKSSARARLPTVGSDAMPDRIERWRDRLPWSASQPHIPHRRPAHLLRAATRLVAVVVAAGAAGTLLGVGFAALTGDEKPPSAPVVPTSSTPSAGGERLPIEVTSTRVRPTSSASADGVSVTVRVRLENATDRTVRPEPPRLLVDEVRVAPEADSASTAGQLLARSLPAGAVAEGTLRFDLRSRSANDLLTARVRLLIAAKFVVLQPVLDEGTTTAG